MAYIGMKIYNIKSGRFDSGRGGFTLIELVVATAVSALVIGIVSVCFSFTLRVLEKTTRSRPDLSLRMVELLQRQLAESDPTPINFERGAAPLFTGNSTSLCFVTAHSVKAISKGVPVVVRYSFDSASGVLSYSEMVMNPYQPAALENFAAGTTPSGQNSRVRVYRIHFPKFTLSYAGKNGSEFLQSWNSTSELPVEILLGWTAKDRVARSMVCMVNSPFPIQVNLLNPATPGGLNP